MEWFEMLFLAASYVFFVWLARFVFIALIVSKVLKSVNDTTDQVKKKFTKGANTDGANRENGSVPDMQEGI